ncbi:MULTISPECIES: hypothetical protein [unclassified Streptomyces]|uniref:hypothetical protein n=1 Tax=unclassified Streptomyces TaxID=2593676 RepID=UPI002DD88D49|nr:MULTISPECIES: hypothetical protein [unclassified Streptomyces]WSA94067.1 hypothetical protein OIE63_22665 [Streptomyces sp. NBC_01795]WSB78492.1 hypothetical protein OHB04_23795 [Streptomyces sp. NBC_01775]WSS13308.1 hypothetical protein OG533_16450 [Streptomyces sp. NBC_01186]WSS42095.1 hypothetical protein OG220_17005 [Streptomyces sp. NBC_01187]
MIRNSLGLLLALIGAAAVVWSPFRPWYDGRHGRDFRIDQLFQGGGITGAGAALFTGIFLVMLVLAVVAVVGALLRSRMTVAVAGVLALGFTVLWMVRQGQAAGSLSMGVGGGLASGAWLALGGSVVLLIAAAGMKGRPTSARHGRGSRHLDAAPVAPGSRQDDAAPLEQPYAGTPQEPATYPQQPTAYPPGTGRPTQEPAGSQPGQAPGQQGAPPESAPDNTRPFPKAPPSEKPHGDDQDAWPHDKRDAA